MTPAAMHAKTIKERVAMGEIVHRYLPSAIWARDYIRCPFHDERTGSMRIYEQGYHCFGCGAHGDAVDFVGQLLTLAPLDAIKRINTDFALCLPIDRKPTLREIMTARAGRQSALGRQRDKAEREAANDEYFVLLDRWLYLANNKDDYAPSRDAEEWHPLFVEALRELEITTFMLEDADGRRCRGGGRAGFDKGSNPGYGRSRTG